MCPNRASGPQNHPRAKVALSVPAPLASFMSTASFLYATLASPAVTFFSFNVESLPGTPHDCKNKARKINRLICQDRVLGLPFENIVTTNISTFFFESIT